MKKLVSNADLESLLKSLVEKAFLKSGPNVKTSLDVFEDFNRTYEPSIIDKAEPELLLFQYGTYDWYDDYGKNFQISFTRQFGSNDNEEEELYQLTITLYFDKQGFGDVGKITLFSEENAPLDTWFRTVRDSKGFIVAESHQPKRYEVTLNLT
ncbi:hypothetical protein [Flaviaesturariibacter amylovorans]|uniref:Uncharacterized protein n=1 Tax=Flaviaesturariibacter amylovorans TaxID=1084520 RepID=A0ABP8HN55_9BACT